METEKISQPYNTKIYYKLSLKQFIFLTRCPILGEERAATATTTKTKKEIARRKDLPELLKTIQL